jgi:hypothetical protein
MSPTIFRERWVRFLFFFPEEPRGDFHVQSAEGEAKFWMDPSIKLAKSKGLPGSDLRRVEDIIRKHEDEIRIAWERHFGS